MLTGKLSLLPLLRYTPDRRITTVAFHIVVKN
jgi:hypothetical protein